MIAFLSGDRPDYHLIDSVYHLFMFLSIGYQRIARLTGQPCFFGEMSHIGKARGLRTVINRIWDICPRRSSHIAVITVWEPFYSFSAVLIAMRLLPLRSQVNSVSCHSSLLPPSIEPMSVPSTLSVLMTV